MLTKIFPVKKVAEIDAYTIKNEPIASIDLMERATQNLFTAIKKNDTKKIAYKLFIGCGNNGGDGLALARMLANNGNDVTVYMVKISNHLSVDAQVNLERLQQIKDVKITTINEIFDFPQFSQSDIIIDALFGSGLSRPLSGLVLQVVQAINKSQNSVVAIDIPSGLMGEDNSRNNMEGIVKAMYTFTFQFPKLSFFFPENDSFVGDWQVLDIGLHPDIIAAETTNNYMLTKEEIQKIYQPRARFAHKGTFGHGLLISGSYGKMGAAILASKAALRSGIGLLTAHIPHFGYNIMQTAVPEAMVSIDRSDLIFTEYPDLEAFDAVGIGPGLGTKINSCRAMADLLKTVKIPMVIDADAINIIAEHRELLEDLSADTIFTPHPKELQRLLGCSWNNSFERLELVRNFAVKNNTTVVVKGAYTTIVTSSGDCFFNPTGNNGMATAGSGDVLTGIILSLLAQNYSCSDAAKLGVYLHGLAGDFGVKALSCEGLIASDVIEYLPKAIKEITIN